MYSSMITPVCTETPNSARNPTPEDTLKLVCVTSSASRPPMRASITLTRISSAHLNERNMRVENDEDQQDGQRHDDQQPRFRALFAFVLAFPVDVIPARQLNLRGHFLDGFLHRAAQIAAAHAVLDGDIALVSFAVDLGAAVAFFDLAELRERNSFAGGRQQTNVLDGFLGVADTAEDSASPGRSAASPCNTWVRALPPAAVWMAS